MTRNEEEMRRIIVKIAASLESIAKDISWIVDKLIEETEDDEDE